MASVSHSFVSPTQCVSGRGAPSVRHNGGDLGDRSVSGGVPGRGRGSYPSLPAALPPEPPRMRRVVIPLVVLAALPAAVTADWPQFRGPTAQGHADKADPPVTWGPKKNVRWRTEVPGSGWSSPVIV